MALPLSFEEWKKQHLTLPPADVINTFKDNHNVDVVKEINDLALEEYRKYVARTLVEIASPGPQTLMEARA